MAAFLFSSHTKRERDREAHLNYYIVGKKQKRAKDEEVNGQERKKEGKGVPWPTWGS